MDRAGEWQYFGGMSAPPATAPLADVLRLDNQLCFSIYAASRAITRAYRPILEPYGLTYPQYLVLLILWESDGQSVNQIGERLDLDSGTLTPLLKRMEQAGFVVRERDPGDERRVRIRLAPQGLSLRDVATRIPETLVANSHLDPDEMVRTKALVDRVLSQMQDCGGRPD